MKLDKPITVVPSKFTDPKTAKLVTPAPITIDTLDIIYVNSPVEKTYYITIKHIPQPVVLWRGEDYDQNPDPTILKAQERFLEITKGDVQIFLQKFFPRTLEDDPYGPGTILHSMFSSLGIKSGPQCSCKQHAIEMNERGIDWCEANIGTILGWLQAETKKRKLPWVESVARLVVNKAINKAKTYRNKQNG